MVKNVTKYSEEDQIWKISLPIRKIKVHCIEKDSVISKIHYKRLVYIIYWFVYIHNKYHKSTNISIWIVADKRGSGIKKWLSWMVFGLWLCMPKHHSSVSDNLGSILFECLIINPSLLTSLTKFKKFDSYTQNRNTFINLKARGLLHHVILATKAILICCSL